MCSGWGWTCLHRRGCVCVGRKFQIGEDEAVAGYDFAGFNRQIVVKHWTGVHAGMEFAVFAARVDGWRQVVKQLVVEFSADKICGQALGIHAGEPGFEARVDHALGEFASRDAPHGEDRFESRAFELLLAVGSDVAEEEVAEGDAVDTFPDRFRADFAHDALVIVIRAGGGEIDIPERKVGDPGLRLDEFAAHAVHGDAIGFAIESGEEADQFVVGLPAQEVEGPGTVFAAAPGKKGALHGSYGTRFALGEFLIGDSALNSR
jgi:hypothetical protein